MEFENFLNSLQETNANLEYFTDFQKCDKNIKAISIKLHSLNYLLGKNDLKIAINDLFKENRACFDILNLLIAVREPTKKLFDETGKLVNLNTYFDNPNNIYDFFCKTGLKEFFVDKKITNLHDYVFGIEVGLDTNARKNRSGANFTNLVSKIFENEKLNFEAEVDSKIFADLDLGDDLKRFDFVVHTNKKTYFIETNFYNVGGSKLNEVARSYTEIANKISKFKEYEFIWITDGQGWLKAKNKLKEAYKSVLIYNLSTLNDLIRRLKNE